MKKTTYINTLGYRYVPEHKGAPYNINGKWANHGEFLESVCKWHRGLDYIVNPTTSYDKGSDIETEKASVKSSGASLGCIYGDTKEEILKEYFEKVASTKWIWAADKDGVITEYEMNKEEFERFCDNFLTTAPESRTHKTKGRFRKMSLKMEMWLELECLA